MSLSAHPYRAAIKGSAKRKNSHVVHARPREQKFKRREDEIVILNNAVECENGYEHGEDNVE